MRVLLVAAPLVGHVVPLVPLATALRGAGSDVLIATGGDGLAAVPRELAVADVAPGIRLQRIFGKALAAHPLLVRAELAGRGDTRAVGRMFAGVGGSMADGVLAAARGFLPDLVVHEPLAVAGALVAAVRGIPSVEVDTSLFDAAELHAAVTTAFARGARRHGVAALPDPAEVLTTAPPSLIPGRTGRPMRFVPAAPEGHAPEDLTAPGPLPRIVVGRSTVDDPRRDRLMSTVVAAAEGLDADVVLVRPDREVADRPLPANVRTTGFLPFPAVFPAASGVVHHGGAGTLLTALACGVPQLLVPGAGDRRVNADLVARRGAGLSVELGDLDRAALERLVSDPALRAAAGEVAAEMAPMPHPADLVPLLADLAAGKGGLPAGSRREPASGGGQGGPSSSALLGVSLPGIWLVV